MSAALPQFAALERAAGRLSLDFHQVATETLPPSAWVANGQGHGRGLEATKLLANLDSLGRCRLLAHRRYSHYSAWAAVHAEDVPTAVRTMRQGLEDLVAGRLTGDVSAWDLRLSPCFATKWRAGETEQRQIVQAATAFLQAWEAELSAAAGAS